MQIFTDEWAAAFRDAINAHPQFSEAAANWDLGPIAAIARSNNDVREDIGLYLEINDGVCRYAIILSPKDAYRSANFVYEASFENWEKIFDLSQKMVTTFMVGKLKVTKGSIYKLMNTDKVGECLVQAAATLMEGET